MLKYFNIGISVILYLLISYNSIAQNSRIETEKIIDNFKINFEKNNFQLIIDDFEKINSKKRFSILTNDEIVLVRYIKFHSEVSLGVKQSFDESNFNELLKAINIIKNEDEKTNYIVSISELIGQIHEYYPEWSIKQAEKILNFKNYNKLIKWNEIKYNLLNIQLNSYNRLDNFKAAEAIRLILEPYNNTQEKKLTSLLDKVYYNIGISQFNTAHKLLKSADTLLIKNGGSTEDSVNFSIVWAKFYKSINDTINANQYFLIAYKIAEKNKMEDLKYNLLYELVLLEPNLKVRINTLENLNSDSLCKDLALKVTILNSLAVAYGEQKLYKKAIDILLTIYEFESKILGKINNATILNLGFFYEKNNQYEKALKYYKIAFNDLNKKINSNFLYLSTFEKSTYWSNENWLFDRINFLISKSVIENSKNSYISFNGNLISKSLLLETSLETNKIFSKSSEKSIKNHFNKMIELRKFVSKMQSEGSTQKEIIERYNQQADSLDKILVNKVGEYANAKRKFEITWKDVQANLSSTEAAIEFARYYNYEEKTYEYMALVVRPEYEYPKLVKLGSEVKIKSACSQKEFPELYNYVWRGIDSLLYGVKTIYYSPVGELNNISFSALIYRNSNEIDSSKSNWSYLIDKYDLRQLTTTRYLADGTLNKKEQMAHSIKLIGGVNYTDLPTGKDSVEKTESTEDLALHINLQNELKHSNIDRGGKINYLKGSEIEVKEIVNTLKSSNWETTVLDGKSASEYQLKKELEEKSPGIIHISTHGFAFPEKETKERNNFEAGEKLNYKISDDPMVRCGLMLSGANISWSGDPKKMIKTSGDDGILTAAEVANLDLSNTKLVVLSACETGLGKIESSEGTFGLKRGFKLAGVDQIIVSLWKVPDNETKELMTLFYSELSKTENIDLSFNNAQKEMRNRYPFEPEKWAGFVLVR